MKCILEDSKESVLGAFFAKGTKEDRVIFANSNSNIKPEAIKLPDKEELVIFFDINPWNKQLYSQYTSTEKVLSNHGKRFLMIPIVCAEYNLLIGLRERKDLIKDLKAYNLIENKELGYDFRKFYGSTSYEKFCKNILKFGVVDRLSTSPDINPNKLYYTNEDCDTWSMEQRLVSFYKGYGCLPLNFEYLHSKEVTCLEDIYDIHISRIEKYNNWVEKLGFTDRFLHTQRLKKS